MLPSLLPRDNPDPDHTSHPLLYICRLLELMVQPEGYLLSRWTLCLCQNSQSLVVLLLVPGHGTALPLLALRQHRMLWLH
jgi:hypothetical protein